MDKPTPSPTPGPETDTPIIPNAPAYFGEALRDAELLLKFASETGVTVDEDTRNHILHARSQFKTGWDEPTAANLLAALGKLASQLKPVTAQSLDQCISKTGGRPPFLRISIVLATLILIFSVLSFIATAISNTIHNDVTVANALAVKMNAELVSVDTPPSALASLAPVPAATEPKPANTGKPVAAASVATAPADRATAELTPKGSTPEAQPAGCPNLEAKSSAVGLTVPAGLSRADIITDLQQFAATIRSIDARARQLNFLMLHLERDPFRSIRRCPADLHRQFELPTPLINFAQAAVDRTDTYQQVRAFAQSLTDDVSFFYGALTACLLPVLYALLGTCAYLLRNYERAMSAQTFVPSHANSARFLIAAIGGAVVGLFNNFASADAVSLPPLALAFLVGYAVDVFFTFLEGFLQTFTKSAPAAETNPKPQPPRGA